jgi:hypothetical protein
VPRFTDNGQGQITDNLTRLVWLKNMDCVGLVDWQGALDFANTLADGKCGLTDGSVAGNWRLPNVNELTSLLDLENAGPTLPADNPFPNVQNDSYWTSTTVTGFTSEDRVSAWRVNLAIGDVDGEGKDDARLFVSAVKGPLSPTPTPTP